ncbi:Bug family tripartite tricarboxylate transporter substrate binding protein [Neoroseomonas oryzicola]|uniref:Tripartite tricarboxylate transporter substrate binding protein n=1 Tax=Neoroseomonas oryzicola TaxID=535904 RepID=A0A9X9WL28_9PROT|nr:tripartite tricarboxylate transporter substrate binding protein [Neoroseomonas oryzicola]MBR0661038.1 tripartite tricarboxylate transporter substrate binding protein [Neoroseomonas oryzicola]NKE18313.1 tripartite tricarboxylate transporter substrate binding protein [Neoroseomonas oryzicola]
MVRPTRRALVLAAGAALAAPARAQAFPSRPIRILVPFAAGGTTDILARAIGERLSVALGQPVVIDNRGGAGGTVAGEAFARSDPDGHTLLVATASLICINKALYARLPFDPDTDFLPVAMLAQQPNVLVVNPRVLPMPTLAELVAYIRAHPGQVNYGSAGTGSQLHLTGEMFRAAVGVDMTHVPYRGSAPAMTDLVAGNVPMMFDGLGTALPQVRGGAIRALGVASTTETAALPGVPPIATVLPGFLSVNWTGLFALRGTPEPVLARIDGETRRALAGPELTTLFRERAFDPMPIPRGELPAFVAAESARWREAVRASGARAD